ncbi:AAA family ATPase [Colwellia ponticola]|uniref:AAA family ATPase n=1 Tax=Colwellia ponticola TaxID=2304625 RepID=A0A8H2JP72_9GAMM|nr:AAA family ATPase [Colwellia ponticola]TMM47539.1 AAA family ATPase [Colwellia ponticola]
MYRNFFSLSDLPFSISPDPNYLFMSDRHREALSHLTYGLGETGGFALLTGEVGTGKTTISRCLMAQLPVNTQAAFILNPTLSSKELLATLCDELKIRYRKTEASLKTLTDKISEKLLKNHQNDINTLLIIDEAQHLQPEVLEQLRLLTNLETNTKKLLQVILIGQPELQQLLQRRDLRQLAQRITARYHLMPLTKLELNQYIQHRLAVANCTRALFDKGALAKIHQLSQGIPRLTNLLCHSALLLAYNQNDSVVNKKTVMAAAVRALGDDLTANKTNYNGVLLFATLLTVAVFFALAGFWWGERQTAVEPVVSTIPATNKVTLSTAYSNTEQDKTALNEAEQVRFAQSENFALVKADTNDPVQQETLKVLPMKKLTGGDITNEPDGALMVSAAKPNRQKEAINYQVTQAEGVSNDLLARFQAAIAETATDHKIASKLNNNDQADVNLLAVGKDETIGVKPLSQLSAKLQNALPSLQFEQHIYSSDGQGWVTVNGRDRYEGDQINDDLRVDKILPQQVILSFKGEQFSLPALTNW